MRGQDGQTGSMFSYVDLEERVPLDHPLRKIRAFVNVTLAALHDAFTRLYSADGRPSIAPERLLRAALIQILFSMGDISTLVDLLRARCSELAQLYGSEPMSAEQARLPGL